MALMKTTLSSTIMFGAVSLWLLQYAECNHAECHYTVCCGAITNIFKDE